MRLILPILAALSLSACASADQRAFYRDIEGCSRHYVGSVSAGGIVVAPGFSGSIDVQCDPLLVTKANAAKVKDEAAAAKSAVAAPPS